MTPTSSMALGQAARTIHDYLQTLEEGEHDEVGHPSHQGRIHPPFFLLSQQLHDLTVASTSTSQSPEPSASHERAASPPPWSFCYKESRGVQAETASALLLLWVRLVTRHLVSPDEQALLCLTMDCLASLVRHDRLFQYLITRLWHQKSGGAMSYIPGVSLQTFCLETFVDWRRGPAGRAENEACSGKNRSKVPVTSSQLASLLRLWDVLAARQPLEVQVENYPLLAECLLHPVYKAASTPSPLSPTRRERTKAPTMMTMERKEKKAKKGGGRKWRNGCTKGKGASPRVVPGALWDEEEEEAGEEVEEEEEEGEVGEREEADGIPERLTMNVGGHQDEKEEEDPNVLLLPSLHLLSHAARGSPSFRLFVKALDHREEHLIFDALLSLVVSAQSQPSTTPLMALATLGALSRLTAGDVHFESRVFDRGNVRETTKLIFPCLFSFEKKGGWEEGERTRAAVDLWGDFLASPLVLGFLEEEEERQEGEGLPSFLAEAVVALGDIKDTREGGGEKIEALLRALRVVCEESSFGQSLLIRSLLPLVDENEEEERKGGKHSFHLTKLVELALSPHVPTAIEAIALLQQLFLGVCDESSLQLWAALTVVLTIVTTSSSIISGNHGVSSPRSSRAWPHATPPSATIQLSRSPLRRHRQQAVTAAAAVANAGACAHAPSLLDLLVDRLHALADEVEVCCVGSGLEGLEIGSRGLNEAVFLEVEWSLRPVLSLLCWVITTAFCHAPSLSYGVNLRKEIALRLDARAVFVIVLGVAHMRNQVWQDELRNMTAVVHDPKLSPENLLLRSSCLSRLTLMERTVGCVPSMCPVERLEVVVWGCRLMLVLGSVCDATAGGAGEEEGEGGRKKAEWPDRLVSDENPRHRHWLSIALNSSAVIDILAAVLHQGSDRELVSQTLSFLTDLKNVDNTSRKGEGDREEGPEWSGMVDGLFRRNQAMHGSLHALEKEMSDVTHENGRMIMELQEINVLVKEAEGQRAALQAAHDQEMERVGQDWGEEVLKMREAAKVERSKHHAEIAGIISDREGWQARAEAAETELAQVQEAQQAKTVETSALQKQVEALTVQLMQCQKESMTYQARAAELAIEIEEHRQRAYDACRQKEEAEEVVRKSNAQVDKAIKKMATFSDAFKAKDEAAKVGKARLRKLDVHVGAVEKELAILRGRLAEAEGENRRLAALHEVEAAHREQEERTGEENMERILEDMKALRTLVEVKTEAMRELEYAHQQALDELQEKDGLLMDQEEALRRQQHAAILIKRLVTAVEDDEEGEWAEGGRGGQC